MHCVARANCRSHSCVVFQLDAEDARREREAKARHVPEFGEAFGEVQEEESSSDEQIPDTALPRLAAVPETTTATSRGDLKSDIDLGDSSSSSSSSSEEEEDSEGKRPQDDAPTEPPAAFASIFAAVEEDDDDNQVTSVAKEADNETHESGGSRPSSARGASSELAKSSSKKSHKSKEKSDLKSSSKKSVLSPRHKSRHGSDSDVVSPRSFYCVCCARCLLIRCSIIGVNMAALMQFRRVASTAARRKRRLNQSRTNCYRHDHVNVVDIAANDID